MVTPGNPPMCFEPLMAARQQESGGLLQNSTGLSKSSRGLAFMLSNPFCFESEVKGLNRSERKVAAFRRHIPSLCTLRHVQFVFVILARAIVLPVWVIFG
jgi:hypothetical protein